MMSGLKKLNWWALFVLLFISTNIVSQNLLVNPNAETGNAEGWIDLDDVWGAAAEITPHEGSYFFWPSRGNLPFTQIYQDVDVSGYSSDSYFYLSGWLANWDQSPHDKATLAIAAFDNNGNQLFHASREHRNPSWGYYEIFSQLPVGTQKLRVYLIATRYVGSDNDAYFDDLSLEITNDIPSIFVNITSDGNKKDVEIGSTLQLSANTSGGSDNSYAWSSSYDEIATVDENGLVTAVSKGTFTIQAIGNNTQAIGYISLVSHPENYIMFNTPEGGEEWESNQEVALTWDVIGTVGTSTLYWSSNDGVDWEEISEINPSTGGFLWSIPATDDNLNNCLVKIAWSGDESISESFSILPSGSQTNTTLKGRVTNAVDGTAISGALVAIGSITTTTDSEGNYELFNIPLATLSAAFFAAPLSGSSPLEVAFIDQSNDASHTLVVSATDFSTYTNNQVVINNGETLVIDVSLSPILAAGEMRIVLNWGSSPDDLDSYLKTPIIDGYYFTVYYITKGSATSAPYATLDHDDQSAFGPETITIYKKSAGTYNYYVHKYSSGGELVTSNAVVQVYDNNGLVRTVNVPTTGSGDYWNVLKIDGGTGNITVINEIGESIPTSTHPIMPTKTSNMANIEALISGIESITSWAWSFGDGATSTEQNPTHTYSSAGKYTVSLVVSNGTNNATETKTDYISVVGGEEDILIEKFDSETFPANGWSLEKTITDYSWRNSNPSDNPFTEIDATNIYSAICPYVTQDQDENLKTPILSFPNDNINLSFYAGYSTSWLSNATLKVNISTDGGATWNNLWEAQNDGEGWKWRLIELDLSIYKNNSNVMLAWQYVGNDGDLVALDNVKISSGIVGVDDEIEISSEYKLSQNYPNPFNPSTVIEFTIPEKTNVSLTVFNSIGEEVARLLNQEMIAGYHSINFNANNLSSGIYFYRISAGNFSKTNKMMLLR